MPVPKGPVFRHGTRAQPFERLAPGTSVATAIGLARNIPTDCSCYADTPQPGTPRVMRLQVELPHGARFIPADSKQEGRERRGRDEEGRERRGRDEEGGNGADGTNAGWDVGGRAFR